MEDNMIIELYNKRDESAISESQTKFGKYCYSIAYNILYCHEDCEECVNDTWLRTWKVIPPEKPRSLRAFFGRITRNLALDRYRYNTSDVRSREITVSLDELGDCVSSREDIEREITAAELGKSLNKFLSVLSVRDRNVFIMRYYYLKKPSEIAEAFGMKENYVRNLLSRTRKVLKEHLKKEGFEV